MTNDETPQWFDPHAPLESTVVHVAGLSPHFHWVGIYVLRGDVLTLGPFVGDPTPHTRIPVGIGICGTAVARGADLNVPDVSQVSNYLACSTATRSELVVLVRGADGLVLGQIDIDSHVRGAFGVSEESAVRAAADVLGRAWPQHV